MLSIEENFLKLLFIERFVSKEWIKSIIAHKGINRGYISRSKDINFTGR